MNNIDDGNGTKESRLKIIRSEPIAQYSWDNKEPYGENDWTTASLQEELNTTYLNSISSSSKEMIENAVWNLGGLSSIYNSTSIFYTLERGDEVYTGRAITWTGQIGLMYPSDYGFATSGGNTGRTTCLSYNLGNWNEYSDCYNNDWLYDSLNYQWTLIPVSINSFYAFYMLNNIPVYSSTSGIHAVSPALYLSSNVKITSGTGTSSDPFELSL